MQKSECGMQNECPGICSAFRILTSAFRPSLPKHRVQLIRRQPIPQPFGEQAEAEAGFVLDLVPIEPERHEEPVELAGDVELRVLAAARGDAVVLDDCEGVLRTELI